MRSDPDSPPQNAGPLPDLDDWEEVLKRRYPKEGPA